MTAAEAPLDTEQQHTEAHALHTDGIDIHSSRSDGGRWVFVLFSACML